jgi:hypothetical protein
MADSRSNINDIWNTFKQHLFKCLDKHIPSKIIKSNNRLPWFNDKIKKMLRKKQSLYNQAKRTKNWSNYKHYQKDCKRQIRIELYKLCYTRGDGEKQYETLLEVR